MEKTSGGPLAIIAGSGSAPRHVAAAAQASGRRVFIVGMEGEADADIADFNHTWLNWGQIGSLGRIIGEQGAREVVLIGGIKVRPDFAKLQLDRATANAIDEIRAHIVGGDDNVLSGAVRLLEAGGLRVVGAHEVAADLVAAPGPLGRCETSRQNRADILLAMEAARLVGKLDAGQAAVVVEGHVIALEGAEGTDAMMDRVRQVRDLRGLWRSRAGVLAKCAKPQQDLRVDMPAIGPRTVDGVAAAGLAGIAIEAGRVMIVDRAETIGRADAADVFIVGETAARPRRQ